MRPRPPFFLIPLVIAAANWIGFQEVGAKETPVPDWVAKVPKPVAGSFPLPDSRPLRYTAGWAGVVAGKISIDFSKEPDQQTLHATGGTLGGARLLFPLDADFTAHCDPVTLAPREATIIENYRDEKRTTRQVFSPEKMTRKRSSEPANKDDGKTKIVHLPNVLDLQSSILFLRSQPLKEGDQIEFLTYATGSPYLAKVTVLPKEEVTVPAGTFSAHKLHLDLTGIDKKLALKPYRRARNITAWLSDDAERRFLRFSGDLLIGKVFVELDR